MKLRRLLRRSPGGRAEAEPEDAVVYLATVGNEPMAQMWADMLREEGIRTVIKAAGPGVGAWASAATFEHELYVLQSQLTRAQALLGQMGREDASDMLDSSADDREWAGAEPAGNQG